ncbi:MAG TPA: hypothetical protein VHZ95_13200, partial [Polyangiales bacterium]|nr:hypothetical protein [Polyangiales bacterium]
RVDGIAAIVGGAEANEGQRTILRSDVELRARLSLLGHDVTHALLGELPASLLAATLDELLGEQLIATEAERVEIAKPSPNEIARERRNIEHEAGGRRAVLQLLGRLDATESELDTMAARRALISAFLRANLEGVTVVTENEIDARLRGEGARTSPPPSAAGEAAASPSAIETRDEARAAIAKEALTRNVERWVRVLRARTRVRVLANFEAP